MDNHWGFDDPIDDLLGFIYCITEVSTGRMYVGRKQFWSAITRPPLKGRKRKRRGYVESNWSEYTGSSESLAHEITTQGMGAFRFEVIATFSTKTGMALGEASAIICSGALEQPDRFFNRAAPSIKGRLKVTESDEVGLRRIREWISHLDT